MDAWALLSKFIAVFYKMTCEILSETRNTTKLILISIIVSVGVESLSAVLPAIRKLTYANH